MRYLICAIALSACVAFAACGGDGASAASGSGASSGGASSSSSAGASMGGAGGGDGDDDFDHARALPPGDPQGVKGALDAPSDRDYFTFNAAAGTWLRVFTTGNPWNDPARINTVLRLFDASHTLIAEDDDNLAPEGLDAEILTRLPASGAYFIEVLEHSDLGGGQPRGGPGFGYGLVALIVDPAKGGVVIDPELGDDAASAAPAVVDVPTAAYDYGEVLGGFEHASDIDVYSFAIDEAGFIDELLVLPDGAKGDGSTAPLGRAWVTDAGGAAVHARIDGSSGTRTLSFVGLDQGLVWIERPAGPPGANDFYVAKILSRPPEHEYELEDPSSPGANDVPAGAESIVLLDTGVARVARWFTRLSTVTDVDQYALAVKAGAVLALRVSSASAGAGVIGLHVQIVSDKSEVLAEGVETPSAPLDLTATVKADGTVYVRFDKAGQDIEVQSDYVDSTLTVAP